MKNDRLNINDFLKYYYIDVNDEKRQEFMKAAEDMYLLYTSLVKVGFEKEDAMKFLINILVSMNKI